MSTLTIVFFAFYLIRFTCSMYYLTNFHVNYPYAHTVLANCSDTVSLSCNINTEDSSSSSTALTMWFRLYEDAYPQPLIVGDRQIIDDQRFMLRTQNHHRHLEIVGVRKDDQGYYICKIGDDIQASYNLTILTETCIDIIQDSTYVTVDEPLQLNCRIRTFENYSNNKFHIQWRRNNHILKDGIEYLSNNSFVNGIYNAVLTIKQMTLDDTGSYQCRYGELLSATVNVIVNPHPGGSKSRRLISQLRGNSSSSSRFQGTVDKCFYIVYTMFLVTLVVLS